MTLKFRIWALPFWVMYQNIPSGCKEGMRSLFRAIIPAAKAVPGSTFRPPSRRSEPYSLSPPVQDIPFGTLHKRMKRFCRFRGHCYSLAYCTLRTADFGGCPSLSSSRLGRCYSPFGPHDSDLSLESDPFKYSFGNRSVFESARFKYSISHGIWPQYNVLLLGHYPKHTPKGYVLHDNLIL